MRWEVLLYHISYSDIPWHRLTAQSSQSGLVLQGDSAVLIYSPVFELRCVPCSGEAQAWHVRSHGVTKRLWKSERSGGMKFTFNCSVKLK